MYVALQSGKVPTYITNRPNDLQWVPSPSTKYHERLPMTNSPMTSLNLKVQSKLPKVNTSYWFPIKLLVSRPTQVNEIWQTYSSESPPLHQRTSWPSLCCRCPSWKVPCRSCPDGTNCISSSDGISNCKHLRFWIKSSGYQDGERRYWRSYSTGNKSVFLRIWLVRVTLYLPLPAQISHYVTLLHDTYFSVAETVTIINVNDEYDL